MLFFNIKCYYEKCNILKCFCLAVCKELEHKDLSFMRDLNSVPSNVYYVIGYCMLFYKLAAMGYSRKQINVF